MTRPDVSRRDVTHATIWGLSVAATLLIAIFIGSNALKHYDAALVPYTGACVFAAFGIGYRFSMWLRRPPTRKYWFSGWRIFFQPSRLPRNVVELVKVFFSDFFAQRFIEKRSHARWVAHWLIAWGCILAAAVTFPLSFGWVNFKSAPGNQEVYRAFVFGQQVSTFHLGTITAALTFNILDISAVMVLLGVGLALYRRARDRGAISVQQFAQDMMPLLMLFAISITGLFLTASTHLLHGLNYGFLSMLHAVTVIFTLLYLPFGKFFHIFQRPAQIGVQFYKEEGARTQPAACIRCQAPFASRMHVQDLKDVEAALGIRYQFTSGAHYQDVCPACRRKSLAMAQDAKWRDQVTRSANSEPTRDIWPNYQ
ncbi:MAG TPA: MFS transporter [Candidatus Angelobacter sp.]|nr:MFS transporter [Candidatus Angelobacter sp.]